MTRTIALATAIFSSVVAQGTDVVVTFTIYLPNVDHQDLFWASIGILALNFLLRVAFAYFSLATTWFSNKDGCGGKVCCCRCLDGTRAACNDTGYGDHQVSDASVVCQDKPCGDRTPECCQSDLDTGNCIGWSDDDDENTGKHKAVPVVGLLVCLAGFLWVGLEPVLGDWLINLGLRPRTTASLKTGDKNKGNTRHPETKETFGWFSFWYGGSQLFAKIKVQNSKAYHELIMALCEDIPEIILDVIYLYRSGFRDTSSPALALFLLSAALSIWHAATNLYAFWHLRQEVQDVKHGYEEMTRESVEADAARWQTRRTLVRVDGGDPDEKHASAFEESWAKQRGDKVIVNQPSQPAQTITRTELMVLLKDGSVQNVFVKLHNGTSRVVIDIPATAEPNEAMARQTTRSSTEQPGYVQENADEDEGGFGFE